MLEELVDGTGPLAVEHVGKFLGVRGVGHHAAPHCGHACRSGGVQRDHSTVFPTPVSHRSAVLNWVDGGTYSLLILTSTSQARFQERLLLGSA